MNSHYDSCVSAAGRQVIVAETGVMYDMQNGAKTQIFNRDSGLLHISCRNTKRPGWVYISNDNAEASCSTRTGGQHYQRVYALKLDTTGTRENYAWAHSKCPSSYSAATMAAPSPSGTRVWFKGNWDGQTSAVHSYVAQR
jgi:hypothetical protein